MKKWFAINSWPGSRRSDKHRRRKRGQRITKCTLFIYLTSVAKFELLMIMFAMLQHML